MWIVEQAEQTGQFNNNTASKQTSHVKVLS